MSTTNNRTISDTGLELIQSFEGLRTAPYLDAVGIPTIGYGMTIYPDGRTVTMQDAPISKEQAQQGLRALLARYEGAINRYAQVPLTQNQFDALVSWCYNVGAEAVRQSTLMKMLNRGDYQGAANQLLRWDRAGGRALKGLQRRRMAERALFLKG